METQQETVVVVCAWCKGTGRVIYVEGAYEHSQEREDDCPICDGTGKVEGKV